MSAIRLNGCDYLMLGFDLELRRQGYAGNSCQILLELDSAISPTTLENQLARLTKENPILAARAGGWVRPQWRLPRGGGTPPRVRVHPFSPELHARLFCDPLAVDRGELARFDLIQRPDGRMSLVFTWAHSLMDARSAEVFLAMAGGGEIPGGGPPPTAPMSQSLKARAQLAWKYIHHLDQICLAAPRSMGVRYPEAPAQLRYRVERFTPAETARARTQSSRYCGPLGDAQFHAAVGLVELHRLHERVGRPSPSYVLPIPVALRPKGTVEPLFSNQVSMLMCQLFPAQLESLAAATAALKVQVEQGMRAGLVASGMTLGDLFRFLPLPLYMKMVKHGLRGEICSVFYGDVAAVNAQLANFQGAAVMDFAHVAAITPGPGVGVIYYYFRGELRVTVVYARPVLSEAEAEEFAAAIRRRLLET